MLCLEYSGEQLKAKLLFHLSNGKKWHFLLSTKTNSYDRNKHCIIAIISSQLILYYLLRFSVVCYVIVMTSL